MLDIVIFGVGLSAVVLILVLSTFKFVRPGFEFWPPPSPTSWQHTTFRILFRMFFFALIVLSFLDFQYGSYWRYVTGGSLLVIGFGLALRWTGFLGWRDAFGEATGLKTEGPFGWSRNPIYVASIVGMLGWVTVVASPYLSILLGIWTVLYIAAPFLEEPWLEREFGQAFAEYAARVPRYLALGALTRSAVSSLELKLPPVLIVLLAAAFMYWCAVSINHSDVVPLTIRVVLASGLMVIGCVLLAKALHRFHEHETTFSPLSPSASKNVVTTGIYAYSRNPMYLAMLIMLMGWGVYLGQLSAALGLMIYMVVIGRLQIVPEERALSEKFGEPYADYLSSTQRWFGIPSK